MIGPGFDSVLDAARAGAEWAWSALYRDLAGQVLGYLRAQGAAEPEDRLGDVFLQLARNISTFAGDEAAFRSWVFMVAHHRVIDERRRRSRRREHPTGDDRELEEAAPPAPAADEQALSNLTTDSVYSLLEGLSDAQRDVLSLRIIAGMTIPEIAVILRKRPGAVKALQRRGLDTLRREMGVPL
jgi:RNA polymerase sigma-70 factor (ECF subfamily)